MEAAAAAAPLVVGGLLSGGKLGSAPYGFVSWGNRLGAGAVVAGKRADVVVEVAGGTMSGWASWPMIMLGVGVMDGWPSCVVNMDCCWSWLIVGCFWEAACWLANGLFSWPNELLDVIWLGCVMALPNGFVLLGRADIRLSKLTRDEFSPKKLSGVFRIGFVTGGFDVAAGWLWNGSVGLANGSKSDTVCLTEFEVKSFHGFVDGLDAAAGAVPKKSPNGSSFVAGLLVVLLFEEKSSKSSSLLLLEGGVFVSHGSAAVFAACGLLLLAFACHGLVVFDATFGGGAIFHGSWCSVLDAELGCEAHGSFKNESGVLLLVLLWLFNCENRPLPLLAPFVFTSPHGSSLMSTS